MSRKVRIAGLAVVVACGLWFILFALTRVKEDGPHINTYEPWIGTVEKGSMLREVRGLGSLVRVRNPSKLVARVKILDSTAAEVRLNQSAEIDTRQGLVKGHVRYISPSPSNELRSVDIAVDAPLPEGVTANLQVDATIHLGIFDNVLYVGRPIHAEQYSSIPVFKLVDGGGQAVRVNVKFGRSSVNTIEVLDGLKQGDKIISAQKPSVATNSVWQIRCGKLSSNRTKKHMAERKYYVFMTFGPLRKRKERGPSVTN